MIGTRASRNAPSASSFSSQYPHMGTRTAAEIPAWIACFAAAPLTPNEVDDAQSRKSARAPVAATARPVMLGPRTDTPTLSPDCTPAARSALIRAAVPLDTHNAWAAPQN